MLTFRKEKMIERLKKEGRESEITPDILKTMDDLDGQACNPSCWLRVVKGEPVFWVVGKSGKGEYVNEADCA